MLVLKKAEECSRLMVMVFVFDPSQSWDSVSSTLASNIEFKEEMVNRFFGFDRRVMLFCNNKLRKELLDKGEVVEGRSNHQNGGVENSGRLM